MNRIGVFSFSSLARLLAACLTEFEAYSEALQAKKWGFAGLLSAKAVEAVPDTPEALPSKEPSYKENKQPEEACSQDGSTPHDLQGSRHWSSASGSCLPQQKPVGRGSTEALKDKILAALKKHNCNDAGKDSTKITSICAGSLVDYSCSICIVNYLSLNQDKVCIDHQRQAA